MNNKNDAAEMFTDMFMVDYRLKILVAMRIRVMQYGKNSDTKLLGEMLWKIGKEFKGNDSKIAECVNLLYSEFVKRV